MADFNLFGDPTAYQGLLSDQQLGNAQNQGLLSAAAALLQAGGPSLQKHSLGQALGQGYMAGQQGFNTALEQGVKGQMNAIQLQNAKRNLLINNAIMGGLMPGAAGQAGAQSPTAATGTTAAAPSLAPAGGAAAGGDSTGTQAEQPAAMAAPAQTAAATNTVANEFQIPGMSPTQSLAMFVNSPNSYWSAMAKARELPQFARDLQLAGIDPHSRLGQQLAQQYVAKQNYIAPVSLRPGAPFINSAGQLETTPAAAPAGFQNIKGPDGQWSVQPVQGGAQALTTSTEAETLGKQRGTIMQGVDAQGNPAYTTGAQVLGGTAPTAPAPLRNNNPGALMPGGKLAQYPDFQSGVAAMDQNLAGYGKQGINTLSGVIGKWAPPNENDTKAYIADVSQRLGIKPDQQIDLSNPAQRHAIGAAIMLHENGSNNVFAQPQQQQPQAGQVVRPGLSVTQKALMEQGQKYYDTAVTDSGSVNLHRQLLGEIQNLAADPKNTFGPGAPAMARVLALAKNAGVDMTGAQTAQDVMKKLSAQIAVSQLGTGAATGTNAQLEQIMAGTPHGEMTNKAIMQVVPMLQQQLDLKEARANVINREVTSSQNTQGVPNLVNQFNRLATPQTVALGRQAAAASANGTLKEFVAKLTPAQRALLPNVQKLDAMGAF